MEQVLLQNSKNIKALIDLMIVHEENIKKAKDTLSDIDNGLSNVDHDVSMNAYLYVECEYSALFAPSAKICPMSRSYFTPSDKVILVRECGHIFKKIPFLEWTKNHKTCPRCSTKLI